MQLLKTCAPTDHRDLDNSILDAMGAAKAAQVLLFVNVYSDHLLKVSELMNIFSSCSVLLNCRSVVRAQMSVHARFSICLSGIKRASYGA